VCLAAGVALAYALAPTASPWIRVEVATLPDGYHSSVVSLAVTEKDGVPLADFVYDQVGPKRKRELHWARIRPDGPPQQLQLAEARSSPFKQGSVVGGRFLATIRQTGSQSHVLYRRRCRTAVDEFCGTKNNLVVHATLDPPNPPVWEPLDPSHSGQDQSAPSFADGTGALTAVYRLAAPGSSDEVVLVDDLLAPTSIPHVITGERRGAQDHPRVAIDSQGRAAVVYATSSRHGDVVELDFIDGQQPPARVRLSQGRSRADWPSIASHPDGTLIASWSQRGRIHLAECSADCEQQASWTRSKLEGLKGGVDTHPSIVLGPTGQPSVVFDREQGGRSRVAFATRCGSEWSITPIDRTSQKQSVSWARPALVSTDDQLHAAYVTIDSRDRGHVRWASRPHPSCWR